MRKSSLFFNIQQGIKKKAVSLFHNPYKDLNIGYFKLKLLKHLPKGKLRHHKMFDHNLYYISPEELLHGLKEIFIEEIYKQMLPENAVIIDCGANIGLSILYLKKIAPSSTIYGFEPDENNFVLLTKNIKSYKLENVFLKQEAVWKEDCELSFSNDASMSSKIDTNSISLHKVKAIRLKNMLNQKIDFLKIDIEGAEFDVIKDCDELLCNVKNLFIEYHGTFEETINLVTIFQILNKNNFHFYIKEADNIFSTPFYKTKRTSDFDVQLNIFAFNQN